MAFELYGMLAGNVSPLTGEPVKPAYGGENEAFLMKVIKPIYNVIAKVGFCFSMSFDFQHLIAFFYLFIEFFLYCRKLQGVIRENQNILSGETTMI